MKILRLQYHQVYIWLLSVLVWMYNLNIHGFILRPTGFLPSYQSLYLAPPMRTSLETSTTTSATNSLTRLYDGKIEPTTELYQNQRFAILGGGAFSLALSKVLSYKNISSNLLVRNQSVADYINTNRYHPKYLTNSLLPRQLWATSDPEAALRNVSYIVHAVPMQQSRSFLKSIKHLIDPKTPILSVTKGVELSTFCLMNELIVETLGEDQRAAFLSGPSFAQEIMDGEATAVVIASTETALAKELADILSSVEFRCHTSKDVKVGLALMLYVLYS